MLGNFKVLKVIGIHFSREIEVKYINKYNCFFFFASYSKIINYSPFYLFKNKNIYIFLIHKFQNL